MGKNGKGRGGNAHDRAMHRAEEVAAPLSMSNDPSNDPPSAVSVTERILRFVDHGSTQTVASIVGGLVGAFLDGRYFAVLALWVSYALRRSGALENINRRWILSIHIIAVTLAAFGLFGVGVEINTHRPQTYTPSDYANAVRKGLPLPITQHITNVYNSYMAPEKTIGEPRLDLSEFIPDTANATTMSFHNMATNDGTAPALDVKGSAGTYMGERSNKSEDSLFQILRNSTKDADQPRHDQPPGPAYSKTEPVVVAFRNDQDKLDYQAGIKVFYIGRIDTYRDARGGRYESELCMFMAPNSGMLIYCNGHNKVRKLGGG